MAAVELPDAILHPALPTLQNTDGDPSEPTTMTYQLSVAAAEAFERLRPLATLGDDAHIDGEAYDSAGAIAAAELTWIKAGNRRHRDWDNTALGTLRLDGDRLVVKVNSARRRDRIAKEIAKRFGQTATLVETKVTDVVKELESRRAPGAGTGRTVKSPSPEPDTPPELEALEAEWRRSTGTHGSTQRCPRSGTGRHVKLPRRRGAASGWWRSSPTSRARRNGVRPRSGGCRSVAGANPFR